MIEYVKRSRSRRRSGDDVREDLTPEDRERPFTARDRASTNPRTDCSSVAVDDAGDQRRLDNDDADDQGAFPVPIP
jgi:hypothetical protein